MSVVQHGKNLFQMTRLGAFSCFLLQDQDGLVLLDTGLPGSANQILSTAKKLGAPIKRILLTHAHMDHVGSLDALVAQLSGVEVLISEREAPFLRNDFRLLPNEPQTKPRGSFTKIKTQITATLNAGERIGSLEVIATPGHTPGHISFFDTRDGTLIAGDAFTNVTRPVITGTIDPFFPLPVMGTWNKNLARESAKHVLELQPKRMVVSHGRMLEQPQAAIRRSIDAMKV